MANNYVFHSTCYDRELLRKQVICLNENGIDYQLITNEDRIHARAPLSSYFETELHIGENDFEKADKLLKDLMRMVT